MFSNAGSSVAQRRRTHQPSSALTATARTRFETPRIRGALPTIDGTASGVTLDFWEKVVGNGGHQFALHIAAGLGLGGNESYPKVFAPFGGFADSTILQQHGARMTNGDFEPGGLTKFQLKDLDNTLDEAAMPWE